MSASWGVDIENKVSKKANQTSVNILSQNLQDLQEQINTLTGGEEETSLKNLSERITINEQNLTFLLGTEGTEEIPSTEGKISEIETSIQDVNKKIENEYVSINSITNESNQTDYIFVKKSDYESDKIEENKQLSESIKTKSLVSDELSTDNILLSGLNIATVDENLVVNSEKIALSKEVPIIKYLSQSEYDSLENKDENVYYYTTNEETYITKTEFDNKIESINSSIQNLTLLINQLQNDITDKLNQLLPPENSDET